MISRLHHVVVVGIILLCVYGLVYGVVHSFEEGNTVSGGGVDSRYVLPHDPQKLKIWTTEESEKLKTQRRRRLQHEIPLPTSSLIRPIRLGFAVDDHTYRDVMILINSIVESAYEPKKFAFHIVACGQDELSSNRLKHLIQEKIDNCYPEFIVEQRDDQKKVYTTTSTVHEANPTQNTFTYEILAFHLPEDSGFELQLLHSLPQHLAELRRSNRGAASSGAGEKGGGHHGHANKAHGAAASSTGNSNSGGGGKLNHWNSLTGADMTRFYLPSLFPYATKLLYLDNDIIVNCCIEEIYDTQIPAGKVIGLALDDLHWAVTTQFQWHYNASHPLVIKALSRGDVMLSRYPQLSHASKKSKKKQKQTTVIDEEPLPAVLDPNKTITEITTENFMKLVPKYPNDGVLLFNVSAYNSLNVLGEMEEIAYANGQGDFVVNMGTQQFTVLSMFDRWVELTPRANLRHFPDMARGYLMWFTYNGLVHFAGQSKPRTLCATDSFRTHNWLRVQSYTGWLLNHYHLFQRCGLVERGTGPVVEGGAKSDLFYEHCLTPSAALNTSTPTSTHRHLIHPTNKFQFYFWLREILSSQTDMNNIYVKIGLSPLQNDLFYVLNETRLDRDVYSQLPTKGSYSQPLNETGEDLESDVLAVFEQTLFFHSLWTMRIFEDIPLTPSLNERWQHLQEYSVQYHEKLALNTPPPPVVTLEKKTGKKNAKNGPPPPSPQVPKKRVWKYSHNLPLCQVKTDTYVPLPENYPQTYARNFTTNPRYNLHVPCTSVLNTVKEEKNGHWDVQAISIFKPRVEETLRIFYALDLVFMRPRVILLCFRSEEAVLNAEGDGGEANTVKEMQRALRRVGYVGGHSQHFHASSSSSAGTGTTGKVNVVYVWGVRTNLLEYT